jgi:hypothetical protein
LDAKGPILTRCVSYVDSSKTLKLSIAKVNGFFSMNEENNWPTCKLSTFSFYNVKDHGCVFWGENFHHKRKSLTQLGSHIVIKPLDVALVFLSFTWVNPHYKVNSRKSFP